MKIQHTNVKDILSGEKLYDALEKIDNAAVCLIGDMCLDVYWRADMRLSELSRETPHFSLPIVDEKFSPGAAGNVACNIAALKPKKIFAIGVRGLDWRGEILQRELEKRGVDTKLIVRDSCLTTNAYIKPIRCGISDVEYEDPRLDFENRTPISAECEEKIIENLTAAAEKCDVICVCDQLKNGCVTENVRKVLCQMGKAGKKIVVDSRDRLALFENVNLKPNEVELSRMFGKERFNSSDEFVEYAKKAFDKQGKKLFVTLGENGCIIIDRDFSVHIDAVRTKPPIDFCGAGDTFNSALCTCLASGIDELTAACIATICSSVTIKKLGQTGTATRKEILEKFDEI